MREEVGGWRLEFTEGAVLLALEAETMGGGKLGNTIPTAA